MGQRFDSATYVIKRIEVQIDPSLIHKKGLMLILVKMEAGTFSCSDDEFLSAVSAGIIDMELIAPDLLDPSGDRRTKRIFIRDHDALFGCDVRL
jgi:hypothetical protein